MKNVIEDNAIENYIQNKGLIVHQALDRFLPLQIAPYDNLFSAARYSLLGGGKRLRPILTITTAEMLGCNSPSIITAACAIEMIHTYSLIHDDLPCMDNDDFRRGQPTLHKMFDEGIAVLAGDYLLTHAFEILANDPLLTASMKIQLISLLAKKSGGEGMIAGQVMDIESEGNINTLEKLEKIHHYKTGALISASLEFGGIVAGASTKQLEILKRFGTDIGLAFQIIDDVLDESASLQKHGKIIPSDKTNNKTTYVSLLGSEHARQKAYDLWENAQKYLNELQCNASILLQLAEKLVYRDL